MTEKKQENTKQSDEHSLYEVGFHLLPTVAEGDVEKEVGHIREAIKSAGGTIKAEGAAEAFTLSYPIVKKIKSKNQTFETSYFGWIKFEAMSDGAVAVQETLAAMDTMLRSIVVDTVIESSPKPRAPRVAPATAPVFADAPEKPAVAAPKESTPEKAESETQEKMSKEDMDKEIEKLVVE